MVSHFGSRLLAQWKETHFGSLVKTVAVRRLSCSSERATFEYYHSVPLSTADYPILHACQFVIHETSMFYVVKILELIQIVLCVNSEIIGLLWGLQKCKVLSQLI